MLIIKYLENYYLCLLTIVKYSMIKIRTAVRTKANEKKINKEKFVLNIAEFLLLNKKF